MAARREFETAIKLEDTLAGARWALMTTDVESENFDKALEQLRELVDREQTTIETIETDPKYASLVASPAFAIWKAEREAPDR